MFIKRLEELMEGNNISEYKLTQELKLSKSAIWNWKQGCQPSADKIIKIAEYFDVTTDYLLGRESDSGIINTNANLAPMENDVLTLFRKLSKQDQFKALGFLQALAS